MIASWFDDIKIGDVVVLIGVAVVVFVGYRYSLIKTAKDTIDLLTSKIEALEDENKDKGEKIVRLTTQYSELQSRYATLESVVTSAGEIRELKATMAAYIDESRSRESGLLEVLNKIHTLLSAAVTIPAITSSGR